MVSDDTLSRRGVSIGTALRNDVVCAGRTWFLASMSAKSGCRPSGFCSPRARPADRRWCCTRWPAWTGAISRQRLVHRGDLGHLLRHSPLRRACKSIFGAASRAGLSLLLTGPQEPVAIFLQRAGAAGVTHISGTPSHWRRAASASPEAFAVRAPRYIRLSGEIADQSILNSLHGSLLSGRCRSKPRLCHDRSAGRGVRCPRRAVRVPNRHAGPAPRASS